MTDTPPWGSPLPPPGIPGPGLPHPSAGQLPVVWQVTGTGEFFLIVEQLVGSGDRTTWQVEPAPIRSGTSRERARSAALDLALSFRPEHPFSPGQRSIFRVNDDSYLVVVQGAARTFHFRVTVAEQIG